MQTSVVLIKGNFGHSDHHTHQTLRSSGPSDPQTLKSSGFQTLDLGVLVQWDQTLLFSRWFLWGLQCRVKHGQQGCSQLLAHLPGAEVGVAPAVCVVATGELGEGSSAKNGRVIGAEGSINHQTTVKHQEGVVDALEGVVVYTPVGEVEEHLGGQSRMGESGNLGG